MFNIEYKFLKHNFLILNSQKNSSCCHLFFFYISILYQSFFQSYLFNKKPTRFTPLHKRVSFQIWRRWEEYLFLNEHEKIEKKNPLELSEITEIATNNFIFFCATKIWFSWFRIFLFLLSSFFVPQFLQFLDGVSFSIFLIKNKYHGCWSRERNKRELTIVQWRDHKTVKFFSIIELMFSQIVIHEFMNKKYFFFQNFTFFVFFIQSQESKRQANIAWERRIDESINFIENCHVNKLEIGIFVEKDAQFDGLSF